MKEVGLICCLISLHMAWRIRLLIWGTSLIAAWNWSVLAVLGMLTLALVRFLPSATAQLGSDLPDYLVSTLLLTPLVSVLGARMPAGRAWSVFVVLPLVIVLCWPALSEAWNMRNPAPIDVGTPASLGFLLVLVMAYGNYFGSGNTTAATLYAAGIMIRMWPVTGWRPMIALEPHQAILLTDGLPAAAAFLGYSRICKLHKMPASTHAQAANRLWLTFRDLFGIVWAKRVMDRMNLFATREQWAVLLTLDGFTEPQPEHQAKSNDHKKTSTTDALPSEQTANIERQMPDTSSTLHRPMTVLCWLLTRFASESWLKTWTRDLFPTENHDLKEMQI